MKMWNITYGTNGALIRIHKKEPPNTRIRCSVEKSTMVTPIKSKAFNTINTSTVYLVKNNCRDLKNTSKKPLTSRQQNYEELTYDMNSRTGTIARPLLTSVSGITLWLPQGKAPKSRCNSVTGVII